jgi:integrase
MIYKRGNLYHMDVTINGVRYREALDTTDRRQAPSLEQKRVAEIQAGKGASRSSRDFARKPFTAAADQFLDDRKPHVADRTYVLERNLISPLRKFFGERLVLRISAENIAAYQRERRRAGISGRTLNMEVGVLRRIMKRAKTWNVVAEDVKLDRENSGAIAKVLTAGEKKTLFETAATKEEWLVVYCAAVLAVSTTCRGIELKHLLWRDVDFFERSMVIRRSKTQAGHRGIPLNADAVAALARLRQRAEALGSSLGDHFVFPACERNIIDPTRPQTTWRTAWRSLVHESAKQAGRKSARLALESGMDVWQAIAAWRRAAKPIRGLRFHDLRHQAITELAEAGAPDATLMAVAGHLSREMMEHYSHVRMAAKREALDKLSGGLIAPPEPTQKDSSLTLQ